jgi:2-iminobutanoate/2-iminopropanoate deaminase
VKSQISTDRAPKPMGPYSQGVSTGPEVYCSGQLGIDPATGMLVAGISAQTAQALSNIEGVLAASGMTMADVVKTTVFLADLAEYTQMNEEYEKKFSQPFPARSTIQAAALPRGARVEIDAVAVKR